MSEIDLKKAAKLSKRNNSPKRQMSDIEWHQTCLEKQAKDQKAQRWVNAWTEQDEKWAQEENEKNHQLADRLEANGHVCVELAESYPCQVMWCEREPCAKKEIDSVKRDNSPKRKKINKPLHIEWQEKQEKTIELFRKTTDEQAVKRHQKEQEKSAIAREWVDSQAKLRPDKTKFELADEYSDAKQKRKRLKKQWKTDLKEVLGALIIDPPTIRTDGFDIVVTKGKLVLTMDMNYEKTVEATVSGRTFFDNLQTYLEEHYKGGITLTGEENSSPESGFVLFARNDRGPRVGTDHIEGEIDFVDMPRVFDISFLQAIVYSCWGKVKDNKL